MKYCPGCCETKPESDFYKRSDSKDGLRGKCIACYAEKHSAWVGVNRDRKLAADLAYYDANGDRMRAGFRARHEKNRESDNERNRQWAADHPDQVREAKRQYRQENGDVMRAARRNHYRQNKARYVAQSAERTERIKRATPPWADREAIYAVYEEAHRLTRETGVQHHVDHVIPLKGKSVSGLHVHTNLQILTAVENTAKSNHFKEAA